MRQQCRTCAYRPGCETYEREPDNRLKSIICALASLPFYCHQGSDWRRIKSSDLTPAQAMAQRKAMPICEGWRAEVKKHFLAGRYAPGTGLIRRLLGTRALQLVNDAIAEKDSERKARLWNDLTTILEMLKKRTRKKVSS